MTPTKVGLILALGASCAWAPISLPAQSANAAARQEEVRTLIATLQSAQASQYDKVQACHRLAVVGTTDAVPALAALLSDEKLAHMARYALEPMPDPAVDAALRTALGQLKGQLQVGVINSIGVRRDEKAVDALLPWLGDGDPAVATAAAAALGRIGNLQCASALQEALRRASVSTRPMVADACLVCAERLVTPKRRRDATAMYDLLLTMDLPTSLRMAAMRGAILTRDRDGLPMLVEQLKSDDAAAVAMGLSLAREMTGEAATKALATALGSLPEGTQVLLVVALGDREDKAALPVVLASAGSGATPVRVAALQVLAKLGDVSVVPLLLASAGDGDTAVAEAARATLAMLPGAPVDKALVARVGSGETRARLAAIEALAQRHCVAAVPELNRAASDPDAAVRVAALKALGETVGLDELAVLTGALLQGTSSDEVSAANAALLSAGMRIADKPALAEKLLEALPQAAPQARALLLLQLGQVGGARSLQAVRVATQDPDRTVQVNAVRALAGWPDVAAAPELARIARETPDKALRAAAFRGYVRLVSDSEMSADEKVKLLEQAVALAADAQERKLVLAALGETYSAGSLRMVTAYLADPELVDEVGAAAVKLSAELGARHKEEVATLLQAVLKSGASQPVLDATRKQMRKLGVPEK